MNSRILRMTLGLLLAAVPAFLISCSSNGSSFNSAPQTGTVAMVVSDASNEDWATIGVKILSISLAPQGGGTPVNVYTAPNPVPTTNLVELDQLGEILGNVTVDAGTYTSAILTVSANPSDILLTASANPEAGFAGTAGATIPSSQIQVAGATGASGSQTVPVNVKFDSPLVVTANQSNALDLEFDLAHPAFLVGHVPAGSATTTVIWAVNFKGPVRHRPLPDLTRLVLRHMYGTVGSVASNNASITITRDFPVEPPTNPETAISTSFSQQILADATNGTLYYDVDAKTSMTIKDFSSLTGSLPGKFVRIAARYQSDGTLVAVRIWASSTFNSVWVGPEGHVLHVNASANPPTIVVQNEDGAPVTLQIGANTNFYYRTPWNTATDAAAICSGSGCLATINFVRGFKVHASADITTVPFTAQSIDIEIARYDGTISNATLNGFTYTRKFAMATDDYTVTLPFISVNTPNGKDSSGTPILGFKWWNFAFPTVVNSGGNATSSFDSAVNGGINFGNGIQYSAWGATFATWGDPVNLSGWAAPWTIVVPTRIPLGTAATNFSYNSGAQLGTFTMTETGGSQAVTVDMPGVSGSATLVYQVDRTGGIVTISPVDITTSAGQATLTQNLLSTTPVKVYGVPQPDGTIKAYIVTYFTGTVKPSAIF